MQLKRVFKIEGKILPDPAPSIGDLNMIKKIFSASYPDILNRTHTLTVNREKQEELYDFSSASSAVKVGTHG